MTRIAAYRAQMLARKAAAAGCTVEELIARSETEADRTRRVVDLRFGDRRSGWPSIERRASAGGRSWAVLVA